jgi:hypothetical protein
MGTACPDGGVLGHMIRALLLWLMNTLPCCAVLPPVAAVASAATPIRHREPGRDPLGGGFSSLLRSPPQPM